MKRKDFAYVIEQFESYKGINAIGKTKEGLDIAFNKEYIF